MSAISLFPEYKAKQPSRSERRKDNTAKRDQKLRDRFNHLYKNKKIKIGNKEVRPDFEDLLSCVADEFNLAVETVRKKLTAVGKEN